MALRINDDDIEYGYSEYAVRFADGLVVECEDRAEADRFLRVNPDAVLLTQQWYGTGWKEDSCPA